MQVLYAFDLKCTAELESIHLLEKVRERLDRCHVQLSAFEQPVLINCQRRQYGPTIEQWETFFASTSNFNDRPNTIHLRKLPLKWFGGERPRTTILVEVFSLFGEIRRFHIPLLDEMDDRLKPRASSLSTNGFKKFDFHIGSERFDAFIMYADHLSFVNAIERLRGMKMVRTRSNRHKRSNDHDSLPTPEEECDFEIDFDRTDHLSDRAIRKRQMAKKYGISTLEELNAYKQTMVERKRQLDERVKRLTERDKAATNCLTFLLRKIADRQEQRERDELIEQERAEQRRQADQERQRIQTQLLKAEQELRQRLLQKKLHRDAAAKHLYANDSDDSKVHPRSPSSRSGKHVPSTIIIPSRSDVSPNRLQPKSIIIVKKNN